MKKTYFTLIILLISTLAFAQKSKKTGGYKHPKLELIIKKVQEKHIPDKRVKVFDINISDKKNPTLSGFTSDSVAYREIIKEAIAVYGKSFVNEITLLPAKDLDDKTYGVIKLSVVDIREEAKFSSGMGTQAIMGTPIRILQKDGWYRIQTPDGYLGWAQEANFQLMTKEEFNAWTNASKVIFTDYFGFAYQQANKDSQTISDLVVGNILRYEGEYGDFYKIEYPDGKKGYILKSQSSIYNDWNSKHKLTEESIVKKAFTMMGIPYVWGGTSIKGMDCSGFTKTVLFLHGIILTRDASQQVHTGIPVDISLGYSNLQKGDLMFFGKKAKDGKKQSIRHVAFYIGNNEFIHASGCIRISSLDPSKENYDEVNTKEFVSASRIIGAVDTEGIWSINNNPMYNIQK